MGLSLGRPGRWRACLITVLAASGAFVAAYSVDAVFARIGLNTQATILDEAVLGALAGAFALSLELHHQKELRAQEEKLTIAREMNHHIRNALQIINHLTFLNPDKEAVLQMNAASARIEWALREVLPGEQESAAEREPRRQSRALQ